MNRVQFRRTAITRRPSRERRERRSVNWPPFFSPSPGVPLLSFFLSRCSSQSYRDYRDHRHRYPLGIGFRVTQASRVERWPLSFHRSVSGLLRPGGVLALRHGSHDLDPGRKWRARLRERPLVEKKSINLNRGDRARKGNFQFVAAPKTTNEPRRARASLGRSAKKPAKVFFPSPLG